MTDTVLAQQSVPESIEATELNKIWQEYLQKCCEVGQIEHTLEQIDGQRREWEKKLEVTKRSVKSTANKHQELQKKTLPSTKPQISAPAHEEIQDQAAH